MNKASSSKEGVVLALVSTGVMMAAIDTTIVILAIPTMMKSLNADLVSSVWTILAYLLVISTFTTPLGSLGDTYGRARIYNTGFAVFTLASLLCALSPNIYYLIAFRFLQGLGGAMLQANSSAIITETVDRSRLGRAFSINAIGWNVGSTLGIVLGGVLTTFFSWQSIFLINVPIGVVATVLGFRVLKSSKRGRTGFDVLGSSLLLASMAAISYATIDIAGIGLNSFDVALLVFGLFLLTIFFLVVEPRVQRPIVDVKVLRHKQLGVPLLIALFQSVGYLSTIFLVIMYLQGVLGLDPLTASLILVPGYVIASGMAVFSGRLIDRLGYRIGMVIGLVLMVVSITLYSRLTTSTPVYYVVITSIIGGLGASLYFPSNNKAVMVNAPREYLGSAGGFQRTLTNLGTIVSYTMSILISSLSIPREYAFEIFVGTTTLSGPLALEFLQGLRAAFFFSGVILSVATILAFLTKSTDIEGRARDVTEAKREINIG
jgi:EmrB/QacA subfamily drug resistance transporter